jgi:hypothetical protein
VAGLILALDTLPLEEAIPVGCQRADAAGGAVRGDEEGVVRKEPRHPILRVLVARQVLVEGLSLIDAGVLELDDDPWQSVDEEDHIGDARVERAAQLELADGQEVVALGRFPIHDPHRGGLIFAGARILNRDFHAFGEDAMHLAVSGGWFHCNAIAEEFVDGEVEGSGRGRRRGVTRDQVPTGKRSLRS